MPSFGRERFNSYPYRRLSREWVDHTQYTKEGVCIIYFTEVQLLEAVCGCVQNIWSEVKEQHPTILEFWHKLATQLRGLGGTIRLFVYAY